MDYLGVMQKKRVMTVGDRVKKMRRIRVWSQEDLAKNSGVSPTTIHRLESGLVYPHPSTIRKIAYGLGVQPESLVR